MIWILLLGLVFGGFNQITLDKPYYEPGETAIVHVNALVNYNSLKDPQRVVGLHSTASLGKYREIIYFGDYPLCNGCSIPLDYSFTVPLPEKEGIYELSLKLEGSVEFQRGSDETLSYVSIVPIKVEHKRIINVSIKPDTLPQKGFHNITICTNYPVKNLKIVSPIFAKPIELTTLENCVSFKNKHQTPLLDKQSVPITLIYETPIGTSHNETKYIALTFYKEKPQFDISIENLYSYEESDASLTIINHGDPATNVRISLLPPLSTTHEITLDSIDKRAQLIKNIYSKLDPGIHKVPIEIKWDQDGTTKMAIINGTATVEGKNDVAISLETTEQPVAGKPFPISVVVINRNFYPIKAVTTYLNSSLIQDLDKEKYIGEIDGDDYNSQQYTLYSDKPGTYNLDVLITFKTPDGKKVTKHATKTIYISEKETKAGFPWEILIGAIVIISIGIVLWKRKK